METIFTELAPKAVGPYSQAIKANGFVFLSGQIGLDPATGKAVEGLEAQTKQIMKNIEAVLAEAGTDVSKVVKTTCFLSDMADFAAFNAIYAETFVGKPARSCFAVKELPMKLLVEVEVIALV